jgi:hypothetical protein
MKQDMYNPWDTIDILSKQILAIEYLALELENSDGYSKIEGLDINLLNSTELIKAEKNKLEEFLRKHYKG